MSASKRVIKCLLVVALVVGVALLPACAGGSKLDRELVIGTMITEDILPMWVAESEDLFAKQGIKAHVETFQSAQELTAALTAGELDFTMTDPLVAASLNQGGTPLTMEWVTLGATPEQGRFGLMTSPDSGIAKIEDLAGKPIGVASNTMLEYMMDELLANAGVAADDIVVEEIPKIPVRYEMMVSGQIAAAALPGSLLALGEAGGQVLVADDTAGRNLTISVMVVNSDFAASTEGQEAIKAMKAVWDAAAAQINADGEKYRALLVEKIPSLGPVAATYPVSTYPLTALPSAEMIDPMLAWMFAKGYLTTEYGYDPGTGDFVSL